MRASEEASSAPKSSRSSKRGAARPAKASATESAFLVRKSGIQGRGVFATRVIPKGELIIEYLGKRMTHDEVGDRYDDESSKRHHTFLFSIDDELCVDGGQDGNEACLINHSCAPNAFAEIKSRRIFIRAERAIEPGEEIVYDYWYSTDPDYTLDDLKRIYPCRCGSPECRGTLAAPPKKKAGKKKAAKAAKAKKAAPQNASGVKNGTSGKAATKARNGRGGARRSSARSAR